MRVAVCFWGLCRSTHIVRHSIDTHILAPLREAGLSVDTYVHTFALYRTYTNVRANEHSLLLKNTNWRYLTPTTHSVENQDTVDESLNLKLYRSHPNPWLDDTDWCTFDNHIRSLYSLDKVFTLVQDSGIYYDAILFVRPDCRYLQPLYPDWVYGMSNQIRLPDFHLVNGVNDRFAICCPTSAKVYSRRFRDALSYSKKHSLHSETFLKWCLIKNHCQIHLIPFIFQRVRATGETAPADEKLTVRTGHFQILTEPQKS
jgi:hypothetical protein